MRCLGMLTRYFYFTAYLLLCRRITYGKRYSLWLRLKAKDLFF